MRLSRIPSLHRRRHQRLSGLALGFVAVTLAILGPASPALGAEPEVKLGLRPLDAAGSFFDLTLRPGESRGLQVELANEGESALMVRTYAADVYTIINGGFGADLRDEAASGTTSWLDYRPDVFSLSGGERVERSFTLAVPAGARSGEYITSIILENDEPIRGTGGVALNQVVRQAMAIAITLPGPRQPGLAIGSASHKVVAEQSTVAVAVENVGNIRLKPVADLVLRDAAGAEMNRAQVPMDTFYAHTTTLVEVPLGTLLTPGRYAVDLVLEDVSEHIRVVERALPLEVVGPPRPRGEEPSGGGLSELIQEAGDDALSLPVTIASLVAGVLLGGLILIRIRQRRPRRG